MISTTLYVLLLYVQSSVFSIHGTSPEPVPDSSMHPVGRPMRIQAIKAYDTPQACEDGLKLYAQTYGENLKTRGVMRIRLKCEALQEFTFGEPTSTPEAKPSQTR